MFENIIGYESIKKELSLIISWYMNDEFVNNSKAKLPSGIIFHGRPGNGKTLFIKELVNHFKDSAFVITGDGKDVLKEITSQYDKARKNKLSLVLIDEIDLLVDKDYKVTRILQDELDGINSLNERVLTIATTNNYDDLPEALLRCGRFDRTISIDNPGYDDRKKIIEYYFNKLDIKYECNLDYIVKYTGRLSCAEIMTLCNDCYFRFHNEILDDNKIAKSMSMLDHYCPSINEDPDIRTKETAYHEIGHALMTLKYKDDFDLIEVRFTDKGGVCRTDDVKGAFDGLRKMVESIQIGLGGLVAEKLIYKDTSRGSRHDLIQIRERISTLIDEYPYKSISNVLKYYNECERMETERTRYKNEKIINKILKKCYKKTYKYLKNHKQDIFKYGDMLFEKGRLTASDFGIVENKDENIDQLELDKPDVNEDKGVYAPVESLKLPF